MIKIVAALRSRIVQSLALITLISFLPVRQIQYRIGILDPDVWWHLRVAQWIVEHKTFPQLGIFSQYGATHPWIAYSWGFELIIYKMFSWFQLRGIVYFVLAATAIITYTLFRMLKHLSNSFWVAGFLTAAGVWVMNQSLYVRPVEFTIFLFILELGILLDVQRTGDIRKTYWIPLILFFWANFHIQFVYGLATLGAFVLGSLLISLARKRGWTSLVPDTAEIPAKPLLTAFGFSFLATLIGPYGYRLYNVIYIYAKNNQAYNFITELQAPSFRVAQDYILLIVVVAAYFVLGKRRGFNPFTTIVMLAGTLCGFRAGRDFWFACIPCLALLADDFGSRFAAEPQAEAAVPKKALDAVQFVAVATCAIAVMSFFVKKTNMDDHTLLAKLQEEYPVKAVMFVRERQIPGPIYNNFKWGGFLIANLPQHPVYIDGRNDLYGDDFFLHYASMSRTEGDWKNDPAVQKANLFIFDKRVQLAHELANDRQHKLIYSDENSMVIVKNQ